MTLEFFFELVKGANRRFSLLAPLIAVDMSARQLVLRWHGHWAFKAKRRREAERERETGREEVGNRRQESDARHLIRHM